MKYSGLEEKCYPYLQTPLYKGRLANGLTVYLHPKPDFKETYGMMTVGFGAANTVFKAKKQTEFVTYPTGIAHFLEHKLFEMENDRDVTPFHLSDLLTFPYGSNTPLLKAGYYHLSVIAAIQSSF